MPYHDEAKVCVIYLLFPPVVLSNPAGLDGGQVCLETGVFFLPQLPVDLLLLFFKKSLAAVSRPARKNDRQFLSDSGKKCYCVKTVDKSEVISNKWLVRVQRNRTMPQVTSGWNVICVAPLGCSVNLQRVACCIFCQNCWLWRAVKINRYGLEMNVIILKM